MLVPAREGDDVFISVVRMPFSIQEINFSIAESRAISRVLESPDESGAWGQNSSHRVCFERTLRTTPGRTFTTVGFSVDMGILGNWSRDLATIGAVSFCSTGEWLVVAPALRRSASSIFA